MAVSALKSYNPEVLQTVCRRCGQGYPNRCKTGFANNLTAAHGERIKDAGFRFDKDAGVLVPLD